MVQKPYLVAMRPPDRVLGFSPSGWLMNFSAGPKAYARLELRDFLRSDWELHTPEEIAAAARGEEPQE